MKALGTKEWEIMAYLHEQIFDPILVSPIASEGLKQGVRFTIMRMEKLDAAKWSNISGPPSLARVAA
jgi:hypothetical protein